jgi:Pirin-related protein
MMRKTMILAIFWFSNEEVLSPAKGFNMHPTHYMEVITYVLDGELAHFDNVSNETTHVSTGEFQILHARGWYRA